MSRKGMPTYSLVIPVFNEEVVLPELIAELDALLDQIDGRSEVLFVDDGSCDGTHRILVAKAYADRRYRCIRLSRNFGKEMAVTAGLDRASGAAIIIMDADLQDSPTLIPKMIAEWKNGYEIVYAQRQGASSESFFKRATARAFYFLMGVVSDTEIPPGICDFRLIDRKVLRSFRSMRERDRFVRGMFAWMGYRQKAIAFERPPRRSGETKWPAGKLIGLALDGIMSFSDAPLKLAVWTGTIVSALAIVYGTYVTIRRLLVPGILPGWSSTIVVVAVLSGINMLLTGIVGLYVGRIHNEVKCRPLYLIRDAVGFGDDDEFEMPRQIQEEPLSRLERSPSL